MNDGSANMKKILILSYHFPPMNVIASQRALGYANHFKKFGFEPTIVTYDWSKKQTEQYCLPSEFEEKTILEDNESYKVYRLPILRHRRSRFLGWLEKSRLNKVGILIAWLFGHLDTTALLLDYKLSERRFLKKHLSENKYDVMMGIFSPHFHLSNCSWAGKKFGVKYVLDYRDLWSNHLIIKNYKFDSTMRLKIKVFNFYWKKWGIMSSLQSITSIPWLNKLREITQKSGVVITNGFEKELVESKSSELIDSKVFTIAHTGTIYPEQEFEFILKGINEFFSSVENANCIVLFIGLNKGGDKGKNGELISKYLTPEQYTITKRIPRENVIFIQQNANLLIFPTTVIIPGTYSGKIFEYVNSGVDIITGPRDLNAVCDLITKTNSGHVCNTTNEIKQVILNHYDNWREGKEVRLSSFKEIVFEYSRESQTRKLANYLNEKLIS